MEFHLFKARRGDSVVGNGGSEGFYYIGGPRAGGSIPRRTAMALKGRSDSRMKIRFIHPSSPLRSPRTHSSTHGKAQLSGIDK